MFRKFILITILAIVLGITGYFVVLYNFTYSEGDRTGELIKFSHKGYLFKTYEGEISKGIAGVQLFRFSVLDSDQKVIDALNAAQGKYVKVHYIERLKTFPWWGDTTYFVTEVQEERSPITR
ncbi:MAG: 6-phosphogluconate dehydrogenase [Flavobacterium sp.]|nr:6-phosphogluconate dehydrogenase [Flavobacterium sp.]